MKKYQQHLELCEERNPKMRDELFKSYCRGWFIGSGEAKKELAKSLNQQHPEVDWEGVDMKSLNEGKWEAMIVKEMKKIKKTDNDALDDLKGAVWKITIAKTLRKHTTASNVWLAQRLHMGHPNRVSNAINQ
jgi:putative transposase